MTLNKLAFIARFVLLLAGCGIVAIFGAVIFVALCCMHDVAVPR